MFSLTARSLFVVILVPNWEESDFKSINKTFWNAIIAIKSHSDFDEKKEPKFFNKFFLNSDFPTWYVLKCFTTLLSVPNRFLSFPPLSGSNFTRFLHENNQNEAHKYCFKVLYLFMESDFFFFVREWTQSTVDDFYGKSSFILLLLRFHLIERRLYPHNENKQMEPSYGTCFGRRETVQALLA